MCICAFVHLRIICGPFAKKNTRKEWKYRRHHPMGTVPLWSFVNLCLCVQANKITALHRGRRNKLFSPLFIDADKTPSTEVSSNPLQRGSRGWGMFLHQNHGTGGGNDSVMMGMFVCLCLASKKPSEREFFIPAGMDLAVKLLKLWASYFIVHWSCYWLVCTPFAAADDKGRRFGHHCCRRTSLNLIKHKGHYK